MTAGRERLVIVILALALIVSTSCAWWGGGATTSALAVTPQDDWATVETPHFVISAPERADLGVIEQTAERIYEGMAARYRYSQTEKIRLYIYTNRSAFLAESPSPDAAGYASPGTNTIAILLGVGNSTITLGHEINHIIFLRSIQRVDTVPEWFIEGLAIHESQPGVEVSELEKYVLARDIPDLVGSPKRAPERAKPQDYAQGYLMVGFIAKEFGAGKLYEVIGRLQAGEEFNPALVNALGMNEEELNAAWKSYARKQILLIWLTQLRDIGWYLMALLVIVAVIIAPIQKRRRLREMEDEEIDGEDEGSGGT